MLGRCFLDVSFHAISETTSIFEVNAAIFAGRLEARLEDGFLGGGGYAEAGGWVNWVVGGYGFVVGLWQQCVCSTPQFRKNEAKQP